MKLSVPPAEQQPLTFVLYHTYFSVQAWHCMYGAEAACAAACTGMQWSCICVLHATLGIMLSDIDG